MKLCFFDGNRFGLVKGDAAQDVTAVLDRRPALRSPLPRFDPLAAAARVAACDPGSVRACGRKEN